MITFVKDVVTSRPFAYGATVGALPWAVVFQLFPTHDAIAKNYVAKDQYRIDQQQTVEEVRELRHSIDKLVYKLYEDRQHGK